MSFWQVFEKGNAMNLSGLLYHCIGKSDVIFEGFSGVRPSMTGSGTIDIFNKAIERRFAIDLDCDKVSVEAVPMLMQNRIRYSAGGQLVDHRRKESVEHGNDVRLIKGFRS